jgi:HTH-type transcriptional regulator/antitoxin HigA
MRRYRRFIKPISSEREYNAALAFVDEHFDARKGTDEARLVNLLGYLIDQYEEERFPIPAPSPIEAIKFRMDQMGIGHQELAVILGGRNRVSEIMGKKRQLSIKMIRALHSTMGIPAESLIGT